MLDTTAATAAPELMEQIEQARQREAQRREAAERQERERAAVIRETQIATFQRLLDRTFGAPITNLLGLTFSTNTAEQPIAHFAISGIRFTLWGDTDRRGDETISRWVLAPEADDNPRYSLSITGSEQPSVSRDQLLITIGDLYADLRGQAAGARNGEPTA